MASQSVSSNDQSMDISNYDQDVPKVIVKIMLSFLRAQALFYDFNNMLHCGAMYGIFMFEYSEVKDYSVS